jgi:hypothetical protein
MKSNAIIEERIYVAAWHILIKFGFEVCTKYVKMDLKEIGWDGVDWIDLAQDRDQWRALVNTVMNFMIP